MWEGASYKMCLLQPPLLPPPPPLSHQPFGMFATDDAFRPGVVLSSRDSLPAREALRRAFMSISAWSCDRPATATCRSMTSGRAPPVWPAESRARSGVADMSSMGMMRAVKQGEGGK